LFSVLTLVIFYVSLDLFLGGVSEELLLKEQLPKSVFSVSFTFVHICWLGWRGSGV